MLLNLMEYLKTQQDLPSSVFLLQSTSSTSRCTAKWQIKLSSKVKITILYLIINFAQYYHNETHDHSGNCTSLYLCTTVPHCTWPWHFEGLTVQESPSLNAKCEYFDSKKGFLLLLVDNHDALVNSEVLLNLEQMPRYAFYLAQKDLQWKIE